VCVCVCVCAREGRGRGDWIMQLYKQNVNKTTTQSIKDAQEQAETIWYM
jgi:hypothetical protein